MLLDGYFYFNGGKIKKGKEKEKKRPKLPKTILGVQKHIGEEKPRKEKFISRVMRSGKKNSMWICFTR